ncbi:MAG: hypothetical protein GX876_01515, partial [Bacteroidales bacterium]|nr:hypothetical protein [Bacteroidales bacterium]
SFTISGAYALTAVLKKWAEDFMNIYNNVEIAILEKGTGQGMVDLIDGKADLAMISRPLSDDEKEAGIWMIPVAKDGVAIIVNDNNPYLPRLMKQGLSPDEIQKLFTSRPSPTWGELLDTTGSARAVVYSRADESGAAELLAGFLFRKPIDLKGIEVTGDKEMIDRVKSNIFSAGFCNLSYAFNILTGERIENIQIVPFDLDYDNKIGKIEKPFNDIETAHRSVWLGIYPESLCRDLTLGSIGKPTDPVILAFLNYVINDGQKIVREAGLCELNNIALRFARESLQ